MPGRRLIPSILSLLGRELGGRSSHRTPAPRRRARIDSRSATLRLLVAPLLLAIISQGAASCSGTSDGESPEAGGDTDRPRASILPPADRDGPSGSQPTPTPAPSSDDGRIVFETAEGQLLTVLPTGEDLVELTEAGTTNRQAAWAPDGSRLAWVQHDDTTGEITIATDRYDRSDFHSVPVDEAPFYLYWDPSAQRIANLAPSTAGIDLWIAEPFGEDGPTNQRVDRGEPYFLSWGPSGDELLVHASGFRLDEIDLDGTTVIIDEFPGDFGAATWLPDDTLVFADVEDEGQFLVTTGASGEGRRPLITYQGNLRFAVSNEGNRIVMQAMPSERGDPAVTASTQPSPPQATLAFQEPTPTPEFDDSLDRIDPIEMGVPYVMGTFGGEPFALSTRPALGLFPSPDGQSTAWLHENPPESGLYQLSVDYAGSVYTTASFRPSSVWLRDYVAWFDQYEQSHDFWSPSSNLFVYAGRPPGDDHDRIFVFDRTTGVSTVLVDGVVASFTHTPAAAGAASSV